MNAVQHVARNVGDVFTKSSKGSSDAKRAASRVAKYVDLDDERMEGKRPILFPFGMIASRAASTIDSVLALATFWAHWAGPLPLC